MVVMSQQTAIIVECTYPVCWSRSYFKCPVNCEIPSILGQKEKLEDSSVCVIYVLWTSNFIAVFNAYHCTTAVACWFGWDGKDVSRGPARVKLVPFAILMVATFSWLK